MLGCWPAATYLGPSHSAGMMHGLVLADWLRAALLISFLFKRLYGACCNGFGG